jgi:hypothetical protein
MAVGLAAAKGEATRQAKHAASSKHQRTGCNSRLKTRRAKSGGTQMTIMQRSPKRRLAKLHERLLRI